MARYASGKKSNAMSDISGFKVRYKDLKTTWNNLRVEPEEFDPKQPQLNPVKNIIDATALFKPRPDNDPDNVTFFVGFTQDWTIDPRDLPNIGMNGRGAVGNGTFAEIQVNVKATPVGVAGTGEIGTYVGELALAEAGVAGTGAIGSVALGVAETGVAATGAVGTSASYLQYSVTVSNPGSGNRYYIDSVLQQQLYLQEGQIYRFDQSNSSNSGHPLRFSTTSNGSHGGGSEYTTGVTTYGTPGSAGAYTEITVASNAPTLYYYCTNHSNMGGTSYTPASGTIPFAITVSNPGSGNRYYIDSGGPTLTISITEGTTYKFDQSDSSNSGHPLRFSTTSNGSHGGGSEYTTGVTTNGTPGSSGAYTQITVASGAPTLYYYCTNHSNMGGQLNTPALTNVITSIQLTITETGVAGTGAIGGFGESGDGNMQLSITQSGVAGTGATGTEAVNIQGWGNSTWGQGPWGD